jgi:hypothetical protein
MFLDPKSSEYGVVTYTSLDSGASWKTTLTMTERDAMMGDPAVAFGCDGAAYVAAIRSSKVGTATVDRQTTLVYRSADGGRSWLPPTVLPWSDREYVSVDCTNSKFRGRIYIFGNRGIDTIDGGDLSGSAIFTSVDGGRTFSEKIIAPESGHQSSCQGNPVILSDGTFIAPFRDIATGKDESFVRVIRSDDGGKTFSKAITVARITGKCQPMSFAVDSSAGLFRDRIYGVWTDERFGRSVIMLSYSSDKGVTWSEPIVVNDDEQFTDGRKGPDDFMGTVAVNREGVVGAMWYDRRDSTNNRDWWVRFAASSDGGKSFQPSVRVSEAPFTNDLTKIRTLEFQSWGGGEDVASTLTINAGPSRSYYGGDTAGLAVTPDGAFHPLWIDNRTGTPQVWTAKVTVNRNALIDQARKSQNPVDVTRRFRFAFSNPRYDPATRIISSEVYLVSTSASTVRGPLSARVTFLRPEAEIMNADNKRSGRGATWTFDSATADKEIAAGTRTLPRTIQLRVANKEWLSERGPSAYINFVIEASAPLSTKASR